MGFWEFMTVLVVFSTVFGYLRQRHTVTGRAKVKALEARVAALEAGRGGEVQRRLEVLEAAITGDDLARHIDSLDER